MSLSDLVAPFNSLRTMSGGGNSSYIVTSMFTEAFQAKAKKLAASCERLAISYELHEVATVHHSISPRGTNDLRFTKPCLIRRMLLKHRKPVLYVDSDCQFISSPQLIENLAQDGVDFAIYNWCADRYNDRYMPITFEGVPASSRRFFKYSGCVNSLTTDQLISSGLVQYYGLSVAAWKFLGVIQKAIEMNNGAAEDKVVDFAFNNLDRFVGRWPRLSPFWLPKSYARMAFWIHVEPVIDHPDFPNGETAADIVHPKLERFYQSRAQMREVDGGIFGLNSVVDVQLGRVLRNSDGQQTWVATDEKFWITPAGAAAMRRRKASEA